MNYLRFSALALTLALVLSACHFSIEPTRFRTTPTLTAPVPTVTATVTPGTGMQKVKP